MDEPATPGQNLELAFELYQAGEDMMRARLRREHPDESEVAIEERLRAWLSERPGAEHGDAVGRPGTWPRRPETGDDA